MGSEGRAQGFTHAVSVKFDSRASFDGWGPHPMHKKWGDAHIFPNLAGPPAECIRKMDIDVVEQQKVTIHVVFFELKDSFTAECNTKAIAELSTTLALIPGVVDVA